MQFKRSSIPIKSLVAMIKAGDIDLQPSFQRGEIWSESKKRSLIDSVLRGWYVPPIHLVGGLKEAGKREVLDGKQRLTAIVEFLDDLVLVNGSTDPHSARIYALDGLAYSELPKRARNAIEKFKISVFTLTDYGPEEPGELFFRLNQPATLTAAEKRNAFYGNARDQVKEWVKFFGECGANEDVLGFSNIRMAYDDTLARVALTLEYGTLGQKVTAEDLVDVYRRETGFSRKTDRRVRNAISLFGSSAKSVVPARRFNKATLYSWLIVVARAFPHLTGVQESKAFTTALSGYIGSFADALNSVYYSTHEKQRPSWVNRSNTRLLLFYQDRATARVADVSSVLVRDVVSWYCFWEFLDSDHAIDRNAVKTSLKEPLKSVRKVFDHASGLSPFDESAVESGALAVDWGSIK